MKRKIDVEEYGEHVAEDWINGNRTDALDTLRALDPIASAAVAVSAMTLLRAYAGGSSARPPDDITFFVALCGAVEGF